MFGLRDLLCLIVWRIFPILRNNMLSDIPYTILTGSNWPALRVYYDSVNKCIFRTWSSRFDTSDIHTNTRKLYKCRYSWQWIKLVINLNEKNILKEFEQIIIRKWKLCIHTSLPSRKHPSLFNTDIVREKSSIDQSAWRIYVLLYYMVTSNACKFHLTKREWEKKKQIFNWKELSNKFKL